MSASREGTLADLQDQQLIRAADGGDAIAWALLVDRHGEFVWSMAVRLVGPELAAVVSELVWLRLASQLREVRGARAGGARTWLGRALWDECGRQRRQPGPAHPVTATPSA